MRLKIKGYPHADYSKENKLGFLVYYYPYDAVKNNTITNKQWSLESFSPHILDFKEGKLADIKYFVKPFMQLLLEVRKHHGFKTAYLVPVPSSTAITSQLYSKVPRKQNPNNRNRDDRNIVFCKELENSVKDIFKIVDLLQRIESKPPKEHWDAKRHAESLALNPPRKPNSNAERVLILVDDVLTQGGTLDGCELILAKTYPKCSVIKLTIACTHNPGDFISVK